MHAARGAARGYAVRGAGAKDGNGRAQGLVKGVDAHAGVTSVVAFADLGACFGKIIAPETGRAGCVGVASLMGAKRPGRNTAPRSGRLVRDAAFFSPSAAALLSREV